MQPFKIPILLLTCCGLLLASCARAPVTPFIAPPLVATPTIEVTSVSFITPSPEIIDEPTILPSETTRPEISPTPEPPSPTPVCSSSLRFVEDLTYPDGTIVQAGQSVVKQWRVENNGTCNWDGRYTLRFAGGDALGAVSQQIPLYPAISGATAVIEIQFTAPQFPGAYRTDWQAYDADGQPFGETLYMEIIVQ